MISFDNDTDPDKRSRHPQFYGLVPSGVTQRTATFIIFTIYSSSVLLMRSLSIVLLISGNLNWLFLFLAADFGIFFFYKFLNNDLYYFIPMEGWAQIFFSFGYRAGGKVMLDFTSTLQFRHPCECGGFLWVLR